MQQSSNIPAADVALLLHQGWQSNVIVRFVCLYETQKRTSTKHGRHGQGDPLEVINLWWWSGPGYGFLITFPFLLPLWNRGFDADRCGPTSECTHASVPQYGSMQRWHYEARVHITAYSTKGSGHCRAGMSRRCSATMQGSWWRWNSLHTDFLVLLLPLAEVYNISRGQCAKFLGRSTSGLDFFIPLERSLRALQYGVSCLLSGQFIFVQLSCVVHKKENSQVSNIACIKDLQ